MGPLRLSKNTSGIEAARDVELSHRRLDVLGSTVWGYPEQPRDLLRLISVTHVPEARPLTVSQLRDTVGYGLIDSPHRGRI
jgi:hypothetical protein